MQVLTTTQAYQMAGSYLGESDLERDMKFDQYFRNYRIRVLESASQQELDQAAVDNLDFLIIKER